MRPKEFFSSQTIAEDKNLVFCGFPPQRKDVYENHVKKVIEGTEIGSGKISCTSNLEFSKGSNFLEELYLKIQKSKIIIIDVSHFDPTVQFVLGIAATRKDKLIILGDEACVEKNQSPLAYDLADLNVHIYPSNETDEVTELVLQKFNELWDGWDLPNLSNLRAIGLMEDAKALRKTGRFETALAIFHEINLVEKQNWYVQMEWGITFHEDKQFEKAKQKFDEAIKFTRSNRNKAEVHLEMGLFYEANRQENEAVLEFEKAETFDNNNPRLFYHWALLLGKLEKNTEALEKAMRAKKLKDLKDYGLLTKYFLDKFNGDYTGSFIDYKRKASVNSRPISRPNQGRNPKPSKSTNRVVKVGRDKRGYRVFWKNHNIGDVIVGRTNGANIKFGVFVKFDEGCTGLIFRDKLPSGFDINPKYTEGQMIKVRLIGKNDHKEEIDLAPITNV